MSNSVSTRAVNAMQSVCRQQALIPGSGVCALIDGIQLAIFYLPDESPLIYAIGNRDPIGGANVLSRGIVGDIGGRLVVASPLYKQHFDLVTGHCIEQPEVSVPVYAVEIRDDLVLVQL